MNDYPLRLPNELSPITEGETRSPSLERTFAEIVNDLTPWIACKRATVENGNQQYFDLIESRYPIGINRVAWGRVKHSLVYDVVPMGGGNEYEKRRQKLADSRRVIEAWLRDDDVDFHSQVVWIGDACDLSVHLTIDALLECYPLVFAYPQHSYVLPPTADWCLNYTMEGQLFFGKAANAAATGNVDTT